MKGIEVFCIGELLVDVIPKNIGRYYEGFEFEIHFGGAPANVCVGISRLNHRSGVIAAIGNDPFGDFLIEFLRNEGVDTRYIIRKNLRTTLAFVILREMGERDFFFYAKPWNTTAFTELSSSDVPIDNILETRVIHTSGVSTAFEPISNVVRDVFIAGYRRSIITSFDPNYRDDIWGSSEKALRVMDEYLSYTKLLSMGMEEVEKMFRASDYRKLARDLISMYQGMEIVAIRRGSRGAYIYTRKGEEIEIPAYKINPVDTTGAGDAWTAAFIVYHILESKDLETSVKYANAAGALKCLRRGAVTGFPMRKDLEDFTTRNIIE